MIFLAHVCSDEFHLREVTMKFLRHCFASAPAPSNAHGQT